MTRDQINSILGGMDAEKARLVLEADDAMDRLYAYKLHQKYGVEVVCNPDGDRSKIQIDGEVMNHEQFAAWLYAKENPNTGSEHEQVAGEELPEDLDIFVDDLPEGKTLEDRVAKYLRDEYDHYLAKGNILELDGDEDTIHVSNIRWGRKR